MPDGAGLPVGLERWLIHIYTGAGESYPAILQTPHEPLHEVSYLQLSVVSLQGVNTGTPGWSSPYGGSVSKKPS